jgi:hypothetical protein
MEVIYIIIGLLLILLVFVVYYTTINNTNDVEKEVKNVETYENITNATSVPDGVLEEVIGSNVTYPNAKNPFMNVLIDEIKYNPKKAPAASVLDPSVQVSLDDFFKTQFVNDPTDVFGRSQSQRQFYTTPSTTVPNDQASYQNWLYRIPGKTCKEGGFCLPGTDGGVVSWLSDPN